MTKGGLRVWNTLKKDDVIYEQPLTLENIALLVVGFVLLDKFIISECHFGQMSIILEKQPFSFLS